MRIACVVPSAGKGRRLNSKQEKPFISVNGKPIIAHTLKALEDSNFIDYIVVAVSNGKLEETKRLIKKYKLNKVSAVVSGGRRRFDSVRNALKKVEDADFVIVHDGARPFIEPDLIKKVLNAAFSSGAAVLAVPVAETIKSVGKDFFVADTLDRKNLWKAQTPQVFRKDLIMEAYRKAKNNSATDDSSLAEQLGLRVKIVEGSHRNIKITTPEDLALAKVFIANRVIARR